MAQSKKMKANRKTFTGVLRVYINKFNIPDGEWFWLLILTNLRQMKKKTIAGIKE